MFQNQSLRLIFNDFISLFYPNYCLSCELTLSPSEKVVCLHCLSTLQETNVHVIQRNELHDRFYEIPNLKYALAYCWFQKKGTMQKLLHQLKYGGQEEVGRFLGERYAHKLKSNMTFINWDMICTVPLHYRKYKKRGYNQSDLIAEGVARKLNIPFKKILKKRLHGKSQTRKHRIERFQNVESTFCLLKNINVRKKHILLIDDVLTTGATLQAAAQPLIKAGAQVSILVLAAVR